MKQQIIEWLENIQKIDGTPPKEVIAFNFGLFESESGYMMYLVGGFEYNEDNDDWAFIDLPTSEHRYLKLNEELQSSTWEYILDICSKILSELELEGVLSKILFKNTFAITIGFDDGDLIKIR